jgi:predicted transcriptional regulator
MNKELTKAEEQVMQAVWKVGQGFASDIVAAVESEVAYNTVLTIVRILEQKGFVGHETFNRANRYYPLITREEYMHHQLGRLTKSYFGSARALVSFLVDNKEVTLDDLEAITKELEK